MYFFLALSYYCTMLSFCRLCYSVLPQRLAIIALLCYLPHVTIAPYCRSTLLLLWAPPCYCYELQLVTATSSTLPLLFYHCCCYAWLFALLRCCSTLLLLHLCYFSACFKYQWRHLKLLLLPYLIVVSPYYCFALLILLTSCVSLASTSTLPFFLVGFGFWSLKKQTTTN